MNLFHFTNWEIEKIKIGSPYSTCWNKSFYWIQKTKGTSSIPPEIENTLNSLPEVIMCGLDVKSILKSYKVKSEQLKEYIFEEVRFEFHPDMPSRMKCMYLFENTYNYKTYAELLGFDLKNYNLFEIEPIPNKSVYFKTDFSLLDCNIKTYETIRDNAIKYWKGEIQNPEKCEIILQGDFIIKSIVHEKIKAKV